VFLFNFIAYNISYPISYNITYVIDDNDKKNDKYKIMHKLNNDTFSRELPDSIIEFYKQPHSNFIPVNKLFLEPIQLLILYELFKEIIDTLNQYNIDYWLTGDTLIYCQKFSCFAPWQKSAHIAINYDQCKPQIQKISSDLQKKGIIFHHFEDILNLKDSTCLSFNKNGFMNAVKKHDPSYSSVDINTRYDSFDNRVNPVSVYIIPFKVTKKNTSSLVPSVQSQYQKKTIVEDFATSDIYPLKSEVLVNLPINIANNVDETLNLYESSENFYKLYVGRKGRTYYTPIIIEDIRNYPKFNDILTDFLEFTFKNQIDDE
jgi:hypothetical protein